VLAIILEDDLAKILLLFMIFYFCFWVFNVISRFILTFRFLVNKKRVLCQLLRCGRAYTGEQGSDAMPTFELEQQSPDSARTSLVYRFLFLVQFGSGGFFFVCLFVFRLVFFLIIGIGILYILHLLLSFHKN
jgi:hypothetical protein